MRAMLVAAGFGTRLHPLTLELPKPALPVVNRPVAFFGLEHLARNGFREVAVNTHHLGERLRAALEPWCPTGVTLRFVHEREILGTGGGVRNAWRPDAGEDFVVWNAKLLFAPDLERALRVHRESGAIATMVLRELPAGARFEPVEIENDGTVRRIRGLPLQAQPRSQKRMYTGVQILAARAFADLPERGDIVEHAYLRWLARGERVASVTEAAAWIDVGVTPRHYFDANMAILEGSYVWPGLTPPPEQTVIAEDVELTPNVCLERVVLGPRVKVAAGARLKRVVAWPDAELDGDLSDAIVTSAGRVVRV